jgi:ATP-dependent Lon protease
MLGLKKQINESFLLLPLRELVIFPQTIVPVYLTYKAGIDAIEEALQDNQRLFAAVIKGHPAKDADSDGDAMELYGLGTVVRIIQHLRLPDRTYRIVFHGEYRGQLSSLDQKGKVPKAHITPLGHIKGRGEEETRTETAKSDPIQMALVRSVQRAFIRYAEFSKKVSTETLSITDKTDDPERLCNLIGNALAVKPEKKVQLLDHDNDTKRLENLLEILELENEVLGIQKNISGKVRNRMEKNHRDFILHEQLKEINKELGKDDHEDEFAELEKAIVARNPGEEVLRKARKELSRLRKLQPISPEAGVLRGYLEWIADLPWHGETPAEEFAANATDAANAAPMEGTSEFAANATGAENLLEAQKILESEHYGMEKAKERILEFIAVRELSGGGNNGEPVKGPILCFVGAPGTGKTSLGKSVAHALGRRFVRITLGGVHDEAEIRGHRKTYVGALPGKIIQSMRKAGTKNPVFLLDEIDKLSTDFRGDPASALLEVLDPEQNDTFTDHYMEVPYDLSRVLFIATANSIHTIPYPLLDRMELIEIPGYGEKEKLAIAKQFLIPKELEENGLKSANIRFDDAAIISIIRHWTMESGVRSLQREIARCARRLARTAVENGYTGTNGFEEIDGETKTENNSKQKKFIDSYKKNVKESNLEKLLGRRKYKRDLVVKEERIGVAYGLAWTETGGTILPVETKCYEGSGELTITGNLGDVMKESARIALSYLRSEENQFQFLIKDIEKRDFHIHVPEGAIPKDGPSAGITLAASILSTLCGKAPHAGIVMTGELTLTGRVLPIGGLKEKILAAIRNGMEKVLLPEDNKEEWEELDKDIRSSIQAEFISSAQEAFIRLFSKQIFSLQKSGSPRLKTPIPIPKKRKTAKKT